MSEGNEALTAAEAQIQELKSERANLRRKVTNARKKIERLEAGQAESQQALAEAQAKIDELDTIAETLSMGLPTQVDNVEEDDQVALLIQENRRLAKQLEAASAELAQHRLVANTHEQALTVDQEKTERKVREELAGQIAKAEAENERLQRRLLDLERQMAEKGRVISMPAEQVAELVNELVDQLDNGLPNMTLRDGELRLKVAFGGSGEKAGFVIPTPESTPEQHQDLNEISLRFRKKLVIGE